jgi:hypothetical protein
MTAIVDTLAPLDALNVGNKIASGRMGEISGDEWTAAGIDVALTGIGMMTGGAGYVAGKGLLKGGKIALAADKAAVKIGEKVAATKAAKEAAEIGAMAAIGAAGGKMIKIKDLGKTVKSLIKPAAKDAKTAAKDVKKVVQKAPHVAPPKKAPVIVTPKKTITQPVIKAAVKDVKAAAPVKTIAAPKTAIKTAAKDAKAAPASSLLKTEAKTTEKAIANDASALKSEVKATEKAAIETTAKPGSAMVKVAGAGLLGGTIGLGLASYLGGSGADQAAAGADNTQPQQQATGEPVDSGAYPGDTTLTPDEQAGLNDQIGQIQQGIDDGTIPADQGQQAIDDLKQQIDNGGGNFDAPIGADTPYQAIEDAAQDATRAIPGDPLAWFRQNGLAAPAMGGLIIVILLVVWYAYKKYVKHGSKAGHGRRGSRGSSSGAPGSGAKIFNVV